MGGFPTKIFGYINVSDVTNALKAIHQLPYCNDDQSPYLPREIFALPVKEDKIVHNPISHEGNFLVHFAMCGEDTWQEWDKWLEKFETLLQSIESAEVAFVGLRFNWGSDQFEGYFFYHWERESVKGKGRVGEWKFKGEPRKFL